MFKNVIKIDLQSSFREKAHNVTPFHAMSLPILKVSAPESLASTILRVIYRIKPIFLFDRKVWLLFIKVIITLSFEPNQSWTP